MFVERRDGSIWMLARTKTGILQSFSTDRERTWSEPTPLEGVGHPNARFFIRRLRRRASCWSSTATRWRRIGAA